jgi:hypothetical protein
MVTLKACGQGGVEAARNLRLLCPDKGGGGEFPVPALQKVSPDECEFELARAPGEPHIGVQVTCDLASRKLIHES